MRGVSYVLSLFATGAVVLYAVFTVVAGISPADAALATAVVAAIAAILLLRYVRLEYEVKSQGGDPQLREAYNRQRERRGF
jgi:lysozyme family protein